MLVSCLVSRPSTILFREASSWHCLTPTLSTRARTPSVAWPVRRSSASNGVFNQMHISPWWTKGHDLCFIPSRLDCSDLRFIYVYGKVKRYTLFLHGFQISAVSQIILVEYVGYFVYFFRRIVLHRELSIILRETNPITPKILPTSAFWTENCSYNYFSRRYQLEALNRNQEPQARQLGRWS